MKGCMNCGNISCGNNKKRDCAGCGRWISPEDKIAELEEKVGMAERTRERLIAMGFPTLASCKEYSAKLAEAKKLLKQWAEISKNNACDNVGIVAETENFLEELSAE